MKRILKSTKKRVIRRTLKLTLRNLSPPSSRLGSIAANYKTYYVMHKYRNDCFFSKFYCKRRNIKVVSLSTAAKNKEIKNSSFDKISSSGRKILKRYPIISYPNSFLFFQRKSKLHVSLRSSLLQDLFRVARRKLFISGDIELNPGTTQLPFAD